MKNIPQLDPDEQGNAYLQNLIRQLHHDDMETFIRKITKQPLTDRLHTYRELLLGAHIRRSGANYRYEKIIDGQTPDWSLHDGQGHLLEVIDVFTLHQRRDKEKEITESIRSSMENEINSSMSLINHWTGWITIPPDHIYRKLSDKADQYIKLVRETQTSYVLAMYGEFLASLSVEEVKHVLYAQHNGWFETVPEVSGLIYFQEKNFQFEFHYFPNPAALYKSIAFIT